MKQTFIKSAVAAVALASVVLLAGCATNNSSKLNDISVGMTKADVISVMGQPSETRATASVEYLVYRLCVGRNLVASCIDWKQREFFVQIQQGKVVAYGKVGDFDSTKDPAVDIDLDIE